MAMKRLINLMQHSHGQMRYRPETIILNLLNSCDYTSFLPSDFSARLYNRGAEAFPLSGGTSAVDDFYWPLLCFELEQAAHRKVPGRVVPRCKSLPQVFFG